MRLRLPTVVMATVVFDTRHDSGIDIKGLIRKTQGSKIPQCGVTALSLPPAVLGRPAESPRGVPASRRHHRPCRYRRARGRACYLPDLSRPHKSKPQLHRPDHAVLWRLPEAAESVQKRPMRRHQRQSSRRPPTRAGGHVHRRRHLGAIGLNARNLMRSGVSDPFQASAS